MIKVDKSSESDAKAALVKLKQKEQVGLKNPINYFGLKIQIFRVDIFLAIL